MDGFRQYTKQEVIELFDQFLRSIPQKGEEMASRIKQRVNVNGHTFWVSGQTNQQVFDNYLDICLKQGVVTPPIVQKAAEGKSAPLFGDYLDRYIKIFKSDQQSLTIVNRQRIVKNHILPKFGRTRVDKITVMDIQKWFNELAVTYSKQTILKIKNIMSPALDSAVEDGYLERNPMKSSRIKIGGKETIHHRAIPSDKMHDIRKGIPSLPARERRMCALLSTTGMRFEQVLGLRWQDLDIQEGWIHIKRAVVPPTRNQPQVKSTKTETRTRDIPIPKRLVHWLSPIGTDGFILNSNSDASNQTPLSYTEARRSFDKIRRTFGIPSYSAHDFRDTCATEWREKGIPTDVIARMLGHSKSQITEKRYVKYRQELYDGIRTVLDNTCDTDVTNPEG